MLTRILQRNSIYLQTNFLSCSIFVYRNFKGDNNNNPLLPGGGLEKLQGGIKEEKYFNRHDVELITKIRDQGSQLKCDQCIGNWAEFEKTLASCIESCSKNKHKDNAEEAFFLNEQNDNIKLLHDKLKNEKSKFLENIKKNHKKSNNKKIDNIKKDDD